jgi:hypothetical protein
VPADITELDVRASVADIIRQSRSTDAVSG